MPIRKTTLKTLFLAAVMGLMLFPGNRAYSASEPFDRGWLELLRQEAVTKGVKPATVNRLLPNSLQPLASVEAQSRAQPEKRDTLADYLSKRVTSYRIVRGNMLMQENANLLRRIEAQYHVPPELIMSIWAMETSFGRNTGDFKVIPALVTAARKDPRFRAEVIEALRMVDQGYTEIETEKASWAGAFGQAQFIPTSFRILAADGDGDGRKDVWNNLADVFASAANHLHESGWQYGERWGREVKLPAGFDAALLADMKRERGPKSKTLAEWARLGVRLPGGGALPQDYDKPVALIAPNYKPGVDASARAPVYLVYDNFWAIVNYNSSYKYALAVNMLADAIAKQPERQPE